MEDDRFQKIVAFDIYCPLCKYKDYEEFEQPCHDCLNEPARTDGSHKPINFKEDKREMIRIGRSIRNEKENKK